MRLRILLEPHHGATYAQILALAQATEAGGFDAFFRSDANFKRICEDVVGRDPAAVRLSATVPTCIGRDADDLIRVIENLASQGSDTVYLHVYGPSDVAHIELLGEQVVSRF